MALVKLMLTRWTIVLWCLLGQHSAFTESQSIVTLAGYFAADEPVSVVAANPTATTLIGTNTLTITFEGHPTIGTQIGTSYGTQTGTIVNIFVIGPSTAASTELLPGLSATDACVLTRSLNTGNCIFESTALNTDSGMSIWTTFYETYTLPRLLSNYYTVTAGQEKLSFGTTPATSFTSPAFSTPSITSASSTSSMLPTRSRTSSITSISSISPISSAPISPQTSKSSSNSSMIPTPIPTMPTVSRAITLHDTKCLSNVVFGLAPVIVAAMFSCL